MGGGEFAIRRASAARVKARIALTGPAGSGKTLGGLILATGLAAGGRVCVIDTESHTDADGTARGRSENYAGGVEIDGRGLALAEFDVLGLVPPFSPGRYLAALETAWGEGYTVVVVDSLTHEWSGPGGVLDIVDAKKTKNDWAAWNGPSQEHARLIEAIVRSPSHVICTLRTKTAYEVVENERGKRAPKKVGLAPIQREGVDYEMDVVLACEADNSVSVAKANARYSSRLVAAVQVERRITPRLASALRAWCDGQDARPASPVPARANGANGPEPMGLGRARAEAERDAESWAPFPIDLVASVLAETPTDPHPAGGVMPREALVRVGDWIESVGGRDLRRAAWAAVGVTRGDAPVRLGALAALAAWLRERAQGSPEPEAEAAVQALVLEGRDLREESPATSGGAS